MKYGVLWRKTTKNIGDDVQSYAESLWLPQIDYMVDIEDMESFTSEDDEPVATIMSAWYMWKKWNWPPSKYIYPLWIGLHYNDIQRGRPTRGMPAKFEYIQDGPGRDYLKSFEPIGCRDYYTMKVLEKYGIKNYFSGCVTLTLPRRDIPKPEREYVCLVDVDKKVEKHIRKLLEGTDIDVVVLRPTRPEPSTNIPWEERRDEVIKYLEIYQNAKCVVAFRLHCALPCLALETPILLVRHSYKSVRFKPYRDWFNNAYNEQVIAGEFDDYILNPRPNPDTYKPVREELQKTISAFIEQTKAETGKASELVRTTYTEEEFLRWKNQAMKTSLESYYKEYWTDFGDIIALKKQIKALNKENEALLKKNAKLADKNSELKDEIKEVKTANKELTDKLKALRPESKSIRFVLKLRRLYEKLRRVLQGKK